MRIFLALIIVFSGLSSKAIDVDGTQTFVGSDAQLKAGEAQMGSSSNQGSGDKSFGGAGGGGGTHDGAQKSKTANVLGGVSNTLLGGILLVDGYQNFATGSAPCPTPTGCNIPLQVLGLMKVGMGLVALTQAGMQATSATGSSRTASDSQFSGFDGKDFKLDLPDGSSYSGTGLNSQMTATLNDLAKQGFKYDKNAGTVTAPNGQKLKLSDLGGSASSIASATGLPQSAIEKALADVNAANKKIAAKFDANKVKLSFSGGGGGSGSGAGTASLASSGAPNFGSLFSSPKPAQAKIAGLQKNIGGQPVGIAQDNIFNMVQRRYEEKRKTEFFAK